MTKQKGKVQKQPRPCRERVCAVVRPPTRLLVLKVLHVLLVEHGGGRGHTHPVSGLCLVKCLSLL